MTYIATKETLEKTGVKLDTERRRYAIDEKIYRNDWVLDAGASVYAMQGPASAPKKKSVTDIVIRSFEEDAFGEWFYLAEGINTTKAAAILIDDGAAGTVDFLINNDVIQLFAPDFSKSEIILVKTVDTEGAATQIATATRNFSDETLASAQIWADNTPCRRLFNLGAEPSTIPTSIALLPSSIDNYCAEIRTPMSVSRRVLKTKLWTGSELRRLRVQAMIRHMKEKSKLFLWGHKKKDATLGRTQAQGLYTAIIERGGQKMDVNGDVTIGLMIEFLEDMSKKGSPRKIALCAPKLISAFAYWKNNQLVLKPNDEYYGLRVASFEAGGLELMLVKERQLEGDPTNPDGIFGSTMIVFDPEYLNYCYLGDDDTHLITNVQANDDHGRIDEYLFDGAPQINTVLAHGVMRGVTGYA